MPDRKQVELMARLAALRSLAREMGVLEEEAVRAYERELLVLSRDVKLDRYLGVIAEKRAKEFIWSRAASARVPPAPDLPGSAASLPAVTPRLPSGY